MLFKHQFVSDGRTMHANPNNAGVESEPVTRASDSKRVSYQAKFFENNIDYQQIEDSMKTAVNHYADRLDVIYLYCNKSVTVSCDSYARIEKLLLEDSIELVPFCNQEILDLLVMKQDNATIKNIRKHYFTHRNQHSEGEVTQSSSFAVIEQAKTIAALSTYVEELQSVVDENKKLADAIYTEIIHIGTVQDEKAMWEKLKPHVENVQNYINKNYTNYFHLAAQLCIKFCREDSEKYFSIAVNLHDKLDQRLYKAAVLMEDNKHDEALKALGNIDSTNILNQYLYCLYNMGRGNKCEKVLSEHSDIINDALTDYVSALCYLQSCDFDKAEENINKLLEANKDSLKYQYMLATINYWRYIPYNGNIKPSHGLAIPDAEAFYATTEQINGLKNVASLFEKVEIFATGKSEGIRHTSLYGCLLCAWITDDIKKYKYRDELLRIDSADCVAISFNFAHKEQISAESISALTERIAQPNSGNELILLMRYYLANNSLEKFNDLIEQHADALAMCSQYVVLSLRLNALLLAEDYVGAKNYIDSCSLNAEERERAFLVIAANDKSSSKAQVEKLGKELVKKYGTETDYINLTHFYFRHKKWGGVAYITGKWHKKYNTVLALSYRALALYNNKKYDEAMTVLQSIEAVATLTPALRDLKIHILIADSQFNDAIAMTNESGFRTDDEKAVLKLSSLYAKIGDMDNAIAVLKEFTGRHPENTQTTAYLIQHLERVNPDEAYKYAKQIAAYHPNNPQILMNWLNIGFKTNHDNEVAHLLTEIDALQKSRKSKHKANNQIQVRDIQSTLNFIKERQEQIKVTFDYYLNCETPIHIVLDQTSGKLSDFIYSNWMNESGSALFWHYGGKPDTLFVKNIQSKRIIMDYTACLTAYCLNLFPTLEEYFDIIYIEPYLLPVINSEITYIKNSGQPSREEKDRLLLNFIDTHKDKITIIGQPRIEDIENAREVSGIELDDANKYISAKSANAVIITDAFSNELFKKQIPQEYDDIRERKQVLLDILIENDIFQGKITTNESFRKIKIGDSILIDNIILDEIADRANFIDFVKLFKVHITQITYDNLQNTKRNTEYRRTLLSWMTNFETALKNYIDSGKIKHLKQHPNPAVKIPESHILSRSLFNCVLTRAKDSSITLWCDDRYLNKCNWTVNVFDILQVLKQDAEITEIEYNTYISELVKHHVKYYVPSADYIFACLLKAQTSDNSITETPRLEALRKSVDGSLCEQSKIGRELRKVDKSTFAPPEYGEYIMRLRESFHKIIILIWNDMNKDIVWKAIASTWCLTNLSDFFCDVTFANKNKVETMLSFKQLSLIQLSLSIDESFRGNYIAWVFAFLGYRWLLFPNEYENVVSQTAEFVDGIQGETAEQTKFIQHFILQKYADHLPAHFVYSLFVSPVFNGKWESCNPYELV
jgi:tetratricopeptide (TPR) repeat protein